MRSLIISIVFLTYFAWSSFGTTIIGKVIDVHDGDTITVVSKGKSYKIRLLGIDTPETSKNRKFKKDTSKVYVNNEFNVFVKIPSNQLLKIGLQAKRELSNLV
ncbi:MAG: thermonuclease family protein, partial [Brevinematia bacterium]